MYISLTHLYRNFALRHHWQNLNLDQLVKRIIPAIVIMSIAYTILTLLKLYAFKVMFSPGFSESLFSFMMRWMDVFIAGIRIMSIWLLAYHLYQYARREIRVTKENAQLAIMTREAQLSNLSAQINPHFLFNSLNTIKALVIDQPGSARRGIDLLSELLRNALYNSGAVLIPLKSEMDLVHDYLELEKLRMEERLTFEIEMDSLLEEQLIPRFSIQSLVENAIKHGVSLQKPGGCVQIDISRLGDKIRICVQNPGMIDLNTPTTGIGLKNLQERLRLEYHGAASFDICRKSGGKVWATLLIPMP
ncbi:histidine kinase [Pedobacter metabolipauper]|uniref:Histidine kinase n=2 Tax=Pedobacter metabolipauper TaxID=425513 RepID=A0A4R6SYS4_9SPHI|nr:histidine kinase [Pedobacter metabolipauper]